MNTILPPRGLKGRFMPKVSVATFVYRKDPSDYSVRSVIVNPIESLGNHLKGFDLGRQNWRTFKREKIVGGVSVVRKYLDTVSLVVKS